MKEEPYGPLPIDELCDRLSENWGVPYGAENQIWEHVQGLRARVKDLERENADAH